MRRTTIALDEKIFKKIKTMAMEQGRHFQDCVNELLLKALTRESQHQQPIQSLPTISLGKARVDIADREQLYDVMDAE